MAESLKRIIAVWFVVQILLPFTTPLHACDLRDLLGTPQRESDAFPNSQMPAPATEADVASFLSPLAASMLRVSTSLITACDVRAGNPSDHAPHSTSSADVQQTVLRV